MAAKFPFDQTQLPQITTRKALILVDFQNDFTSSDGALHVSEPGDLIDKAVKLSAKFRDVGDIVWVSSIFEEPRPLQYEQVVVNDKDTTDSLQEAQPDPPEGLRVSSRKLRNLAKALADADDADGQLPDEEAFLSQPTPTCAKASTSGSQPPPAIQEAIAKKDVSLTKSYYSAFNNTNLLRILRARLVMEVFICGSLLNVGVYATALDAAGHGMSITVVEDCCGYRHELRQRLAVKNLIELTGCEIASAAEVLEIILPPGSKVDQVDDKVGKNAQLSRKGAITPPDETEGNLRISKSPGLVEPMTSLRLASNSPNPGATAVDDLSGDPAPEARVTDTDSAESQDETTQVRTENLSKPQDTDPPPVSVVKDKAGDLPASQGSEEASVSTLPTTSMPKNGIEMKTTATTPSASAAAHETEATIEQTKLCSGDSDVIEDLLPVDLRDQAFDKLRDEVKWQRMSHQGGEVPRLVAVQGEIGEDGSIPVYRHPSDESPPLLPFTDTVLAIKEATEKHLGHRLNHVLIQFYRDGKDYISEHSDKTLDIVKNSYIANVSLGAQRTMTLRTKRKDKDLSRPLEEDSKVDLTRQVQKARLSHNSLFRMGLKTNEEWLHSIRQDKRAEREKSPAELAFGGGRISLTFRWIGTFLDKEEKTIWGQGATGKTKEEAHTVINGQTPEAIDMLKAFGTENRTTKFDWEAQYGKGFDVLHMSNSPRLFSSNDSVANMRVAFMLAELGINYAKGSMAPSAGTGSAVEDERPHDRSPMKFVDTDEPRSVVQGDIAIMLYLDACYGAKAEKGPQNLALRFTCFQQALELADKWTHLKKDEGKIIANFVRDNLAQWNDYLAERPFLTGDEPSLADFAFWPILHTIVEEQSEDIFKGLDKVKEYYSRMEGRASVAKVLGKSDLNDASDP